MDLWLNAGSISLGLAAWALPLIAIISKKRRPGLSVLSFALCSISLTFQIFSTLHQVMEPDWAAIEDTQGAVAFAAGVLLMVTLALNGIALCRKAR